MYRRLLFPTDGSEISEMVLDYALDIAAEHDAAIHILNVADTNRDSLVRIDGEIVDLLVADGEEIVQKVAGAAKARGVDVETDVLQGDPAKTIVDYSREVDVDLVVMPTHGRKGLTRFLLGSVTERVINAADVPVVAVSPDEDHRVYPPQSLLVPTDGSRGANLALAEAIDVAKTTGAALHLLHVIETTSLGFDVRSVVAEGELDERADELLGAAEDTAETASLEEVSSARVYGSAYREILSYVRENDVDLVVMGTQGKTDFSRYVLGGVTSKLVRTSPVPVMMLRDVDADE